MGELIFTICYGSALIVAGIVVKVMISKESSGQAREEEFTIKGKQRGSVI